MAKKINVKTSWYRVSADVVLQNIDGEVELANFSGDGFASKSVRALNSNIKDNYEAADYKVLAITNQKFERVNHVVEYVIDASNDEIVQACKDAGLIVNIK